MKSFGIVVRRSPGMRPKRQVTNRLPKDRRPNSQVHGCCSVHVLARAKNHAPTATARQKSAIPKELLIQLMAARYTLTLPPLPFLSFDPSSTPTRPRPGTSNHPQTHTRHAPRCSLCAVCTFNCCMDVSCSGTPTAWRPTPKPTSGRAPPRAWPSKRTWSRR